MKRKWFSPLILLGLSLLLDILIVCVIKVPDVIGFMEGLACGLLGCESLALIGFALYVIQDNERGD